MRDTIDMAREAGLIVNSPYLMPHDHALQGIKAFEALVRADERDAFAKIQFESILQAIRIEREACAKVCDALQYEVDAYGAQCAAAIRARGETK